MKYPKLTTALIASSLLLLSGCGGGGGGSGENSTSPSTETPTPPADSDGGGGNSTSPSTETPTPPADNESSPVILGSTTITSTAGQTIQVDRTQQGFIFHGYEGKIVLLEAYGDTCPHCIDAISSYNRIQAKYPNDVVVIALETYGTLHNAGKQRYITIPKTKTGKMFAFIRDLTGYNRQAVPFLMIFDRHGNKVYQNILANFPESEIEHLIQSLL